MKIIVSNSRKLETKPLMLAQLWTLIKRIPPIATNIMKTISWLLVRPLLQPRRNIRRRLGGGWSFFQSLCALSARPWRSCHWHRWPCLCRRLSNLDQPSQWIYVRCHLASARSPWHSWLSGPLPTILPILCSELQLPCSSSVLSSACLPFPLGGSGLC